MGREPNERDARHGADTPAWWRGTDEEPEPDWAEQIRRARKARGARLKDVFATFEDDAAAPDGPSEEEDPPR